MICYADGREARVGDRVDLDGVVGVIESVFESEADLRGWDLDEPGIMVLAEAYGRVFQPSGSTTWPEVLLLGRAGT